MNAGRQTPSRFKERIFVKKTLKQRNNSIDIFRYICAVLIIAIHTEPFSDVNSALGYFCTEVITRIAVPFFFAVAGFFFIQKLEQGKNPLRDYIKRLLPVYALWSVIYFILKFIQDGDKNILVFLAKCVKNFFIVGSYYHLWFIPSLIIAAAFCTLMFRLKAQKLLIPLSVPLFLIGCLGTSYYGLGSKIPLLKILITNGNFTIIRRIFFTGLPLFICGYLIIKAKPWFEKKFSGKKLTLCLIVSVILQLAEVTTVNLFKIQNGIIMTFFMYSTLVFIIILLLRYPMPKRQRLGEKCRELSNFTYYSHPLFIAIFKPLSNSLLHTEISPTLLFFLTAAVTLGIGLLLTIPKNKFVKLFVS